MKGGRIEVRPVRPDQCVDLRIERNPVEQTLIPKRTKQLPAQYWLEIDNPFRGVVKNNPQRVRPHYLELANPPHEVIVVLSCINCRTDLQWIRYVFQSRDRKGAVRKTFANRYWARRGSHICLPSGFGLR